MMTAETQGVVLRPKCIICASQGKASLREIQSSKQYRYEEKRGLTLVTARFTVPVVLKPCETQ